MSAASRARFEELDWCRTRLGELTLRRRVELVTGDTVYEVKLDDEFLMSSAFTVAERELAHLGLSRAVGEDLDVLVGGLGLGYTAAAALLDRRVAQLVVVEALEPVIDWHERRLLPAAGAVVDDPRCRLVAGDFFALARTAALPALSASGGPFDAILLDIDHTPTHHLDSSHAGFYTTSGLSRLAGALTADGVFGLWSDEPATARFAAHLGGAFQSVEEHEVRFPNPLTGGTSANTVYVAQGPRRPPAEPAT